MLASCSPCVRPRTVLVTGRGSSLASIWLLCQPFCWQHGTLFTTPDEPGKPTRKHAYLGPHAKPSQQEAIFSLCGPSLCLIGAIERAVVTSRQVALTWISPLPEAATPVTVVGVSLAGRQAGRPPAWLPCPTCLSVASSRATRAPVPISFNRMLWEDGGKLIVTLATVVAASHTWPVDI